MFDYSWWLRLWGRFLSRYFMAKISSIKEFSRHDSLLLVLSLVLSSVRILHGSIRNTDALDYSLLKLNKDFGTSLDLLFKHLHLLKYRLLLLASFRWAYNFHLRLIKLFSWTNHRWACSHPIIPWLNANLVAVNLLHFSCRLEVPQRCKNNFTAFVTFGSLNPFCLAWVNRPARSKRVEWKRLNLFVSWMLRQILFPRHWSLLVWKSTAF